MPYVRKSYLLRKKERKTKIFVIIYIYIYIYEIIAIECIVEN